MILGLSPFAQRQPMRAAAVERDDPEGGEGAQAAAPLPPGGVSLSDVQRTLTLFTQGIAGRYLHLKAVGADAPDKDERQKDAPHDHAALHLPESIATFDNTRHNLGAYRIAVLHQLGFIECGTYAFRLDEARTHVPSLPEEKLSRSASQAPELERFFGLWSSPLLMRHVFIAVEGLRIDTAMRRNYPGARADLDRVLAQSLATRPDPAELPPFAALLEALVRFSLGADRDALLAGLAGDRSGALGAMLAAAAMVGAEDAGVYDSLRAAVSCYAAIERSSMPPPEPQTEADDEDDDGRDSEEPAPEDGPGVLPIDDDMFLEMSVDFRGEPNPELVDQFNGSAAGSLTEDSSQALRNAYGEFQPLTREERAERRARERRKEHAEGQALQPEAHSYVYDEWNYRSQSLMKGWCRVFEHRLKGDDHDFIRGVRRRHAVLAHQVRRRFQFIRPELHQRVRRVSDGEELELDGLIDAVIDRRAGFATDERVYMRRDRALRDVSAAFLLDMSASTGIAVPGDETPSVTDGEGGEFTYPWEVRNVAYVPEMPSPPMRTVIDVAKESLALMCDALDTLGDGYAIYGFSGDGREQVDFYVAKSFENRVSARTWSALAAMKPQRSTRMGPAIRHALTKLAHQPTRMKVLIIVSDGYPQDKDYGPDRTDDEYGIQDTAAALREAERAGVQTFCVTIDPAGYDYLKRMCPDNRYMVIDDVADLPAALEKVYRALTV